MLWIRREWSKVRKWVILNCRKLRKGLETRDHKWRDRDTRSQILVSRPRPCLETLHPWYFPLCLPFPFTSGKALGYHHALRETVLVNFGLANVLLFMLKQLCKAKYFIKMNIYIAPFGWSSLITCPPNIQLFVKLVTHEIIFICSLFQNWPT